MSDWMSEWVSPEEVARVGHVPLADVRGAISTRALHAVNTHPRAAGQWLIKLSDADAWLQVIDPAWPADGLRTARLHAQDPASPGIDAS